MEMGPQLKISSQRQEKPLIEPATPGLHAKLFIHYTTALEPLLLADAISTTNSCAGTNKTDFPYLQVPASE